jgi:hypothetical protein
VAAKPCPEPVARTGAALGGDEYPVPRGINKARVSAGEHSAEVESSAEELSTVVDAALKLWQATETEHLAHGLRAGAIGFSGEAPLPDEPGYHPGAA